MPTPSPLSTLSGALKIADKVTVSMEAVGNKIRLNSQGWEDARVLNERQVLMVVALNGQLYLLPEHRPAKFEHVDHDGLHEAGYGPDDFCMSNGVASDVTHFDADRDKVKMSLALTAFSGEVAYKVFVRADTMEAMAAPICATSLAGPSRPSRAINEVCRLAGTARATERWRQSFVPRFRFPPPAQPSSFPQRREQFH
jgi:hypothetical protein